MNPLEDFEPDVVSRCPAEIEDAIQFLRAEGFMKIGSIKFLTTYRGMGLADAKRCVHLSATWRDTREADDAFHDAIIEGSAVGKESEGK